MSNQRIGDDNVWHMTLKRILYAEDEPLIQTVAKLALEKVGGFEVLICSSGAEAVEKAKAFVESDRQKPVICEK